MRSCKKHSLSHAFVAYLLFGNVQGVLLGRGIFVHKCRAYKNGSEDEALDAEKVSEQVSQISNWTFNL